MVKLFPLNRAILPKFGEWNVNDPSSGDDFTVIFNKARTERKSVGKSDATPDNGQRYNKREAVLRKLQSESGAIFRSYDGSYWNQFILTLFWSCEKSTTGKETTFLLFHYDFRTVSCFQLLLLQHPIMLYKTVIWPLCPIKKFNKLMIDHLP
ncbi:hypothetical protein ACFE04_029126 [Oxalis oulophora]